jgi:hypothetical protein
MKEKSWGRNQSRWQRRQTIESDSLFVVESFSKFSIEFEYDCRIPISGGGSGALSPMAKDAMPRSGGGVISTGGD